MKHSQARETPQLQSRRWTPSKRQRRREEPGPPDTAQDAILARQLAEELEGGMYAKVCLLPQAASYIYDTLLVPRQQAW